MSRNNDLGSLEKTTNGKDISFNYDNSSKLSKIKERKKSISKLCKSLSKEYETYKPEKTINLINSYINDKSTINRILYHEVSNNIFSFDENEKTNFFSNLESLLEYTITNLDENNETMLFVYKFYDHVQLANTQITVFNDTAKNLTSVSVDKLSNEVKNIEKDNITILGIFAAILLAFVGGITFSSSVLENIDKVSIYRLTLVIDLLAFILTNTINILLKFILKINNKDTNFLKLDQFNSALFLIAVFIIFLYINQNSVYM
ncbi:MAG: hypothetical protein MJ230_01605 [bacterium]|nr:hypothetical protein [bacterium]